MLSSILTSSNILRLLRPVLGVLVVKRSSFIRGSRVLSRLIILRVVPRIIRVGLSSLKVRGRVNVPHPMTVRLQIMIRNCLFMSPAVVVVTFLVLKIKFYFITSLEQFVFIVIRFSL